MLHRFGLLLQDATLSVFMCESRAMTQVRLISAFIPLLPAVIRSPSCFSSPLLFFSFIFPHLFYPHPPTPLPPAPVIVLIHPALLNYLQSPFFSHSHLRPVRSLDWIAPSIHVSLVTKTSWDYHSFFTCVCACVKWLNLHHKTNLSAKIRSTVEMIYKKSISTQFILSLCSYSKAPAYKALFITCFNPNCSC